MNSKKQKIVVKLKDIFRLNTHYYEKKYIKTKQNGSVLKKKIKCGLTFDAFLRDKLTF